jgi:uncharacterized protein with von Willebrand factor type A (vWA) domain
MDSRHSNTQTPPGVVDRVIMLSRSLRARGFSISMAETIDAVAATQAISIEARQLLREALRSTLVKKPDVRGEFDELFERLFPLRSGPSGITRAPQSSGALVDAISGDGDLADVAAALVNEHAGLDNEVRGERHHVQRVVRAADLAKLMGLALRDDPDATPHEIRARIEELKRLISAEVRGRIGAPDDDQFAGVEDIDFLNASRAELDAMRRMVHPLARQIAAKLARKRQHQRAGRINMRRTVRRSLATGGVPFELAFERRKPHRPELFVLCDISGSVAEFSLFTLTLMSALSAELPRTRSFVFVDAIDEITGLLEHTGHSIEPWQIMRNTNVIGASGHSDYGTVFEQFWAEFGEAELKPTSTVLITGDARSNYQPAHSAVLGQIAKRARSVYWLNPEASSEWKEFDSEMDDYSEHCTRTFEVRNLDQLTHCVEQIL